jgi:hypothetical protein
MSTRIDTPPHTSGPVDTDRVQPEWHDDASATSKYVDVDTLELFTSSIDWGNESSRR